jgi:hypothetical protein
MEVEEDVTANARINLPRDKLKNRQRLNNIHHLTPASVTISKNRLKNNWSTGHPGKGQQQTHQPDRGINRLKNLVSSANHGRIVNLTGSKPNVTAVKISNVTPKPMMANKRYVTAEEAENPRSLLDSKQRRTVQTSRTTTIRLADVIPSVSRSLDLTTTSRRSNTILSEQTPSAHRRIIAPNRRLIMNLSTL